MKKIGLFLILIVLIGSLAACGEEKELTNTAVYQDFTLVLGEAERVGNTIIVHATYTNASKDPYYALCCFAVKAFQNNKEITDISDINGKQAALIHEIKNGQTIDVTYAFKLEDKSAVEILIGEPTAAQTTIGKAVYE